MQRCRPLISQALVNIAYRARLQEQVDLKTLALQASEQRFRSFAAMASDWFWETDPEHRLSYVSAPGYQGRRWSARRGAAFMTLPTTSRIPPGASISTRSLTICRCGQCAPR